VCMSECVCVCLTVCDPETSTMNWPRPNLDCRTIGKKLGTSIFVINKKLPNYMVQSSS